MGELARRPVSLDTDDAEGAAAALLRAVRQGDKAQAFEAFKAWSGMATPGKHRCYAISVLLDYVDRSLDGYRANDGERWRVVRDAVKLLAWWWKHAEVLQGLEVTRPRVVHRNDAAHTWPEAYSEQPGDWYAVEPAPRAGKRYLLVEADKREAAHMYDENVTYAGRLENLLKDAIEWSMPEPVEHSRVVCAECKADLWRKPGEKVWRCDCEEPGRLGDEAYPTARCDGCGNERYTIELRKVHDTNDNSLYCAPCLDTIRRLRNG